MTTGIETYNRLKKLSSRKLIAKETLHNESKERFSNRINQMTQTISNDERRYKEARQRARDVMENSAEMAIAEALEAKLIRCDILVNKSALALLRANEFYHNAMISMVRDVQLNVEYDSNKLDAMIPLELRKPVIDSLKGMRVDKILDPLKEELGGPRLHHTPESEEDVVEESPAEVEEVVEEDSAEVEEEVTENDEEVVE
jgi:hypothetical protein